MAAVVIVDREFMGLMQQALVLATVTPTVPSTPASATMHCVKLLGQRLMAWGFNRQVAEFQVRMAVLNGFTALGIPVTETVG